MTNRIILAALGACLATMPALASVQPATTTAEAPKDDLVRVRLETSAGPIVLALDRRRAPLTVANFLAYVDGHKFDGDSGFAAFGHVVEGMDVVKAILAAPVSATKGDGVMKGQMLDPVVKIVKAARVE
jgi:cyclophilin family peptidyl-prolyl cis-trans isomerase